MDKPTFLSKIPVTIDGDAIGRGLPLGEGFKWWTYGGAVWCWGKIDWKFAVGIVFGRAYFGCDDPANPPRSSKCILFYNSSGEWIEEQDEAICEAAIAALPIRVAITFVTKKEDGTALTGVEVWIDGVKKEAT